MIEENTPVITDSGPFNYENGISLSIRRLDLIDEVTGGNKWYKLKYHLQKCKTGRYSQLVTFGGAFSNHIAATARACFANEIQATGIIRGEPESISNKTLSRAKKDGMNLVFVSRNSYRYRNDPSFLREILPGSEECYLLPEGGSGYEGVKGCMEILTEADWKYDHIIGACGTGATVAGLILSLQPRQHLTGISVLKDGNSIERNVLSYLKMFDHEDNNWNINHEFHFGGYGRRTKELENYVSLFKEKTGVPLEPVYTGKVFYAIEQLIRNGYFAPGSRLLGIHTGGMQYL